MISIEFERVSRWYGPVIGLNDVSLVVRSGVTGLLGPNGAGKSTLLRLVTGQIAPSIGRVRVLGMPAFQNRNVLARLGACPDLERFQEEWTGFAFVRAAAWLCGHDRASAGERARAELRRVGLADAADRPIGAYSKGMRQRLKLAQALVNDPDVLVLDEPLNGMDPVARRRTIDLVRELGAAGRCVLVSSHVLHEVEAMTDRVVLLHHGRVLAEGQVGEIRSLLRRHPSHVTVEVDQPRELVKRLLDAVPLVGMRFEDGAVTLETAEPEPLFREIESLVLDAGFDVRRLFTRDDSLDAVFEYLVR